MSGEIIVALVGALAIVAAAAITALVPLLLRRTQGVVEAEGTLTREHLDAHGATLHARIDDVRTDLDDVRESVARVREWQAGHDAEHLLIGQQPPPADG
ncbi:hypothetical protein [Streptomyces sp. NPDC020141]|uniref:hypothetical protein n=1 Tax=Streptomyces sp. NPDC020141 TaxID=3365065 RepID=UPI0037A8FCAE